MSLTTKWLMVFGDCLNEDVDSMMIIMLMVFEVCLNENIDNYGDYDFDGVNGSSKMSIERSKIMSLMAIGHLRCL